MTREYSALRYFMCSSMQPHVEESYVDSRPWHETMNFQYNCKHLHFPHVVTVNLYDITGCIWARYSVVIIPVNYNLMTVNLFMAMINGINLFRAVRYCSEFLQAPTNLWLSQLEQ